MIFISTKYLVKKMSNNTTAINQYQPYLKMLPSILKYCSSLVGADLADIIQYYLLLDLNNSTANKKNMIKQLNIIYFGLGDRPVLDFVF